MKWIKPTWMHLSKSRALHYWANFISIATVLLSAPVLAVLPSEWTPYLIVIAVLISSFTGFKLDPYDKPDEEKDGDR